MEKFAERLRDVLQARRISQKRLAALMKEDSGTISRWCSGARTPFLNKAVLIARLLDVSLDDLVADEFREIQPAMSLEPEEQLILELVRRLGYDESLVRLAMAPPRPATVEEGVYPRPPVDKTPQVEGRTLADDMAEAEGQLERRRKRPAG